MFNSSTTIFIVFILLQVIYATDTTTSPDPAIGNNASGKDLSDAPTSDLEVTLTTPVIRGGKLVGGTIFSPGISTFLCPQHNSSDICLKPQKFEESESLECVQEALPVARNDPQQTSCGFYKEGLIFNIGYEICSTEGDGIDSQQKNRNKLEQIYTVCYHEKNKKRDDETDIEISRPLYTIHHIRTLKLLQSKILEEERKVKYPYTAYDHEDPTKQKLHQKWDVINELDQVYKLQMLVPVEDMAFGLWRKTTYLNFNLEWQHKKLIPFWNEINDYIRVKAIQLSYENTGILIHTGLFYFSIASGDKDQNAEIWVKMITTVPSHVGEHPLEGIAILMNDFLDDTPWGQNAEIITTMCDDDLCIDSLKKKFSEIGGHVRCCSLKNGKVRQLFDEEDTVREYPELKIPGINAEENVSQVDMI